MEERGELGHHDDLPAKFNRYASSSIMDYTGDWAQWQYPVGSWDRAALLFGYGNKVETRAKAGEAWSLVPYKEGDFHQADDYDPTVPADSGRLIRYYQFCSDENLFNDTFCTHFDQGVTATEITRNFIRDAQPAYFFKNFKRQTTMFDQRREDYYSNKWLWTYYMLAKPLPDLQVSSIRYPEAWTSIWDGVDAIGKGPEAKTMIPGYHRNGGEDLLRASLLAYYYLLYDILGRPEYGYYQLATDSSGQQYWDSTEANYLDATKPYATVDAGTGWGWNDRWDQQTDPEQYYVHLTRIGVELDKIIALEILSVPAIFNDPLTYEKANGLSFWNSLWTNDGSQAWTVIKGLITDNFTHLQNPWCMKCDAACKSDWKAHPPKLVAYPMDPLEGMGAGGLLSTTPAAPTTNTKCGIDELPMRPGMDALFAIYPIYYGIAGASHPWYSNGVSDHMDSMVEGGNHRFTPAAGAQTASFVNSSGTKTYTAVQTADGQGISYQLALNGRKIRNRIDFAAVCDAGKTPDSHLQTAVGHTCAEVLCCYYNNTGCPATTPAFCDAEGWDWSYIYPSDLKYSDLDRVEAMLIMMQDMIDVAGHYQWRVPEVLGEE